MSFLQRLSAITASEHWTAAGWTMIHFLWLGALLALFVRLLHPLLDKLRADLRYAVHLGFFTLLVLLPAGIFLHTLAGIPARVAFDGGGEGSASEVQADLVGGVLIDSPVAAALAPAPAPSPSLSEFVQVKLSTIAHHLPWFYLTGAPLALIFLATGVVGASRLRGQSVAIEDAALTGLFERLLRELAIARPVALALCDRIVAPVLVGIVRPVILIPPAALAGLTLEQVEMILLHELAHVRRWDNLVNLLQRLAEGLLFFHPAVWILSRQVRLERECCCDAAVLARVGRPVQYVETLASLAMPGVAPRYAAAAMANHQLVARIRTILNLEDRTMLLSRRSIACAAGALVVGTSLVVAYGQQAQAPAPAPAPGGSASADEFLVFEGRESSSMPGASLMAEVDPGGYSAQADHLLLQRLAELRRAYLDVKGVVPGELNALEKQLREQPIVGMDLGVRPTTASGRPLSLRARATSFTAAKRPWGPEQATGAPDVRQAGDNHKAWASLSQDEKPEWLELAYKEPVEAAAIVIHETFNPGAVSHVGIVNADKTSVTVFKGKDPTLGRDKGVFVVTLASPTPIGRLRITLDSAKVPGWNEIDAVGLLDAKSGEIHWADSATASSTYAEKPAVLLRDRVQLGEQLSNLTAAAGDDERIARLTAENRELRKLFEEQRNTVQRQERLLRDLQHAIDSLNHGQVNPFDQPHTPGSGPRERSGRSDGSRNKPPATTDPEMGFGPRPTQLIPPIDPEYVDVPVPVPGAPAESDPGQPRELQ